MPFCAPQIVYSNTLTAQTASLNELIFTGSANSLYRVSLGASGVSGETQIALINSPSDTTWEVSTAAATLGSSSSGTFLMVSGNNSIYLSTAVIVDDVYSVYVTIEQLQ